MKNTELRHLACLQGPKSFSQKKIQCKVTFHSINQNDSDPQDIQSNLLLKASSLIKLE